MTEASFRNKTIVLIVVETTIPPVSRANLRMYQLAIHLMKQPQFHVHIVTPSFLPWTRKSAYMDKIIMNQYWGASALIYSKVRVVVRLWHFIASVASIVYLHWYFARKHKARIRVVHAWNPLAGIAAVVGARLIGARVCIDFTDFYSDIARTDLPIMVRALAAVERYILREADHVFVVSQQMKTHLTTALSVQKKKIHIVPDGVDIDAFDHHTSGADIRTQLGFTDAHTVLLFHGDIKHDDGVDILLEAMKIAYRKNPAIRLVILGGGGSYFAHLKRMWSDEPVSRAVHYVGWVPYDLVSKYIAASDVGMMPMRATLNHNLYVSFKLFEYWAMEKPVIVTKLAAISEFFRHNKHGLIIPDEDPQAMADAMLTLASHPKKARTFGVSGRKHVAKSFNWSHIMRKEVAVYTKHLQKI